MGKGWSRMGDLIRLVKLEASPEDSRGELDAAVREMTLVDFLSERTPIGWPPDVCGGWPRRFF